MHITPNLTTNESIIAKKLTSPLTARFGPSLTSYDKSWIFAIGGQQLDTTEVYSIEQDVWYEAPALNKERENASSCEQAKYVYTFGGLKSQAGYQLNDIERLNAERLVSGDAADDVVAWETLQIK